MESLQNTHSHKLQWLLIAVIAWPSAILQANDGANPYRVISERNAFSLGSGSRLAKPTRQPETKLKRDVKLTGIFQHEGVERAAIAVREPGSESARPTFMQLAKGEQKGNIRIEKIDRRTGSVTLTINGVKRQLNFKDNAYASTVTKTSRTPSTARRSTSSKAPSREGKEKKEKKSDTEKLAKINES